MDGNEEVGVMGPQFAMRPRDRRVQVTFPVRITCQIVGVPKPEVTWYHNHVPIEADDGKRIRLLMRLISRKMSLSDVTRVLGS